MSNAAVRSSSPPPADIDVGASIDAAAQACGGDVRAAVWELLIRNAWLEGEVERLNGAVSYGYARRGLPAHR
ncbi:hypothetical protein [Antarcticirhabdus aurantiaca]|uniref:hypothetical protein n=1 Tax=Antarcticirhabdus aurantiaca TaxID=2606717 RepID=UPI00131BFF49|nr:hypothetical protein [Antarcticirhabdus aurantiaca]